MNPPPRTVDLNADLGEGFPNDEALLRRVTSASICCGAHAGDGETIRRTLALAHRHDVCAGAHPGFADRPHFGRQEQPISAAGAKQLILEQVEALKELAHREAVVLRFVKPHGALYNQAQRDAEVARGIAEALAELDLPVLGQPGSQLEQQARVAGVRFVGEGFPERRYTAEGRLVARSEPNAVLSDPAGIGAQAVHLTGQGVRTLCIHGDDAGAVEKADVVLAALKQAGITVRRFLDNVSS